jgi:uncharacterized membrane protein
MSKAIRARQQQAHDHNKKQSVVTTDVDIALSPPTEDLLQLYQVNPEYADRCLTMFEKEQAARHVAMNKELDAAITERKRFAVHGVWRGHAGLLVSTVLIAGCIGGCIYMGVTGVTNRWPYIVIGGIATGLLGVSIWNLLRRRPASNPPSE